MTRALLCLCLLGVPLSGQNGPLAGAIRWDAWHGKAGRPGQAVETSLGPKRWHSRLPFFAKVISDSEVRIEGNTQEVMDREIAYAKRAGLDYWAFVTYEPDDAMSQGLKLYLSSTRKRDIRFCLITEHGRWGNRPTYRGKIKRFVELMADASYQKVAGGRPLLYLGFLREEGIRQNWGSVQEFRRAVDEFRALAKQAGLANPYVVIMDFQPERGKQLADALGCDAISSYATSAREAAAPYSALAAHAAGFWERSKATGAKAVPFVMSGWDRRPRVEHPVPWETYQKPGEGIELYYETPRPAELAAHLSDGLRWVKKNADAAEANALLIYAWNENDEGGWLVPTLLEGDARIEAVRRVLKAR